MIHRWFGIADGRGIAVICGDVSGGLVCRDFDTMAAFKAWATNHPDLARSLPTVETGRPGRHVYCLGDINQIRTASASGGSIIELGDGELRGGGYCLLPPSKHPSGHVYRAVVPFNGDIPRLDLSEAGFLPTTRCNRENREDRGTQKQTEQTEAIIGGRSIRPQSAALDLEIATAIVESLPSGPGIRNRQVFQLARALKAIPALFDADPGALQAYVRRWHKLALPVIQTKPFEETWIDFLIGWPRVKFPKGTEPMAQIMAKAVAAEIPAVAHEQRYESQPLCLLVAICRELQRAAGERPFYLSCRTAARYIHTDHSTASRYLFLLEHDRILKVVTKGGPMTYRATRFRYLPTLAD